MTSHRARSRSRDPDKRIKRHILQCIPAEVDLSLVGLYHFCTFSGTSIPRLALYHALRFLWSEGIRIQYRGGYHYENDPSCHTMADAINRRNPLQSLLRPDVTAFVRDFTGITVLDKTKVLTTIASPCTRISQGILHNSNDASEVGPHAYPSSLFWVAHAGLIAGSETIPPTHSLVISEMVPAALPDWERQFDAAVSRPVEMVVQNGADRRRMFRTSPQVDKPVTLVSASNRSFREFYDGCTWPVIQEGPARQPPTLRSIYPVLLDKQALNNVSSSDAATLRMFQVRQPNGSTRYAGPAHLAQWLELPGDVIHDICKAYPCETEPIDHAAKMTMDKWIQKGVQPPDEQMFSKCGQKVLCKNCSVAAELLGRAWNFTSAVSIMITVIREGFSGSDKSSFTRFDDMCPHYCMSPCQFVHSLAQAKGKCEVTVTSCDFLLKQRICLM